MHIIKAVKISVVIPAYNEEKILSDCLASLANQNFPKKDYEVIVVDNNSIDKTLEIAKSYDVKVVKEYRQGITYPRDTGARLAKGEIIISTDADCWFPPNFLSHLYERYKKEKNLIGICGSIYMPKAPFIVRLGEKLLSLYSHYYSKIMGKTPICWAPNFSFRKNAFQKSGSYPLNNHLLKCGINSSDSDDFGMVKKLLKYGNIIFDKDIAVFGSERRFKNRLLYWFFIEYLIGLFLNKRLDAWLGWYIPTPSYFDRVKPKRLYTYSLAFSCAVFIFTMSFLLMNIRSSSKTFAQAEKKFQKILTVRLETLEKITPYLNRVSNIQ